MVVPHVPALWKYEMNPTGVATGSTGAGAASYRGDAGRSAPNRRSSLLDTAAGALPHVHRREPSHQPDGDIEPCTDIPVREGIDPRRAGGDYATMRDSMS